MSKVIILGGNGRVSKLLVGFLAGKYNVTSVIRDGGQSASISALGASPRVFSLEDASVDEMREVVRDQDVVVWSAGAGGKGGAERTLAVDRDAAVRMVEACGPLRKRFIMVSALSSRRPDDVADWWSPKDAETFKKAYYSIQTYHEAKVAADEALMRSDNRWTIVRPGRLVDTQGTGKVKAGKINLDGDITRSDVAQCIYETIENEKTVGLNIDLLNGDTDISTAINRVSDARETTLTY